MTLKSILMSVEFNCPPCEQDAPEADNSNWG